jgi:hypothetical protein
VKRDLERIVLKYIKKDMNASKCIYALSVFDFSIWTTEEKLNSLKEKFEKLGEKELYRIIEHYVKKKEGDN